MILVIDNQDSFTYNVVQILRKLFIEVTVMDKGQVNLQQVQDWIPQLKGVLLSPGPGHAEEALESLQVLDLCAGRIPIFGLCLGHQVIAQYFGAKIVPAKQIMHGKISLISHDEKTIYKDIPKEFEATRYHSWVVDTSSVQSPLEITSWTKESSPELMGLRHKQWKIEGVQFHPESIMTTHGERLLHNFFK